MTFSDMNISGVLHRGLKNVFDLARRRPWLEKEQQAVKEELRERS